MEILSQSSPAAAGTESAYWALVEENAILREEIQVARKAADLTANLVVKQFEETEKVLRRFQVANAQRKAVLDSATRISIIATDKNGVITVFNTGAEHSIFFLNTWRKCDWRPVNGPMSEKTALNFRSE